MTDDNIDEINEQEGYSPTWEEIIEHKMTDNSNAAKCANEATILQSQIIKLGFSQGAEWQRKQLLNEEIIEQAAQAAHQNDIENGFAAHSWGQNLEIDDTYRSNAKASLIAILGIN